MECLPLQDWLFQAAYHSDHDIGVGKILGIKEERLHCLYEAALRKEMSWMRACIEGGVRKPEVNMRVDDVPELAKRLHHVLSPQKIDELIAELCGYRG